MAIVTYARDLHVEYELVYIIPLIQRVLAREEVKKREISGRSSIRLLLPIKGARCGQPNANVLGGTFFLSVFAVVRI